MKKTLTINLGGIVYHIDDDAYRLLDNYLSNLKHYFRKQEGAEEIVNDIEMRIAELFAEKVTEGKQVITVSDVEEIIARVGKPEDFGIADEDMDSQKRTEQTSSANQGSTQTAAQRRWFRDPDNKLLGGVAAGLAAYFGWDITLVRILMIILVFVPYCPMIILYIIGWIVIPEARTAAEQTSSANQGSTQTAAQRRWFRDPDNKLLGGVAAGLAAYFGWDITLVRILMIILVFVPYCPMIILYIIGWIVIPEARTAAEKLSMRGEAVTIENIGKTVTDGFERVADGVNNYMNSGKPRTFLQKIGDVFVSIAAVLFKIFLVALVILCCPVLFVLAVVLVALVFAAIAVAVSGGALLYEMLPAIDWMPVASVSPMMTLLGTIAGVALIGIPLGAFLYTILRQLFHWSPMGTGLKWSLLILWILGAVIMIINLSALGWQLPLYGLHCS